MTTPRPATATTPRPATATGQASGSKRPISLSVNGRPHELWVTPSDTLLEVLHDELGLPEVRYGCGEGVCGTCTVGLDGQVISACLMFAVQAVGHEITTVSGLLGKGEELHPLQECMLRHGGAQCGFCTPGMLLTADCLAKRTPRPGRDEIRYELVGNLCRCTGYTKILDAIEEYVASPASARGAQQR